MRWNTLALALGTLAVAGGCKKGTGTSTGGGGGGGAWLVGAHGLMEHLRSDGTFGDYGLDAQLDLHGIACQTSQTAFVVGADGTFLRTSDGGDTWDSLDLGTTATLRAIAAGAHAVFVAGDGVLSRSSDGGDTWTAAPAGPLVWTSIATDAAGDVALALAEDGTVWRWTPDGLVDTGALAGAEAVTISPDGQRAAVVGDAGALLSSSDGGATWAKLQTGTSANLHAAWATDAAVLAVGDGGAVVRVADSIDVSWPGTRTLRAVHVDGDAGYAAGEGGEILTTTDGGATWDVSTSKIDGIVYALDLVDASDHL